jgi:hypothetical protein
MALLPAVERLIAATALSPTGQVQAETLRTLASEVDEGNASPAVIAQLSREVINGLTHLSEYEVTTDSPRIGTIRGRQALLILTALGYPNAETVSIDDFDIVELLKLQRARRIARQPTQPGLDAALALGKSEEELDADAASRAWITTTIEQARHA